MKASVCKEPGCFNTVNEGFFFCAKHKDKEENYGKRPPVERKASSEYHHLYNSNRWRSISRRYLKEHPFCIVCGNKATICDHRIPHRGDESLFYNEDNYQSLCWKHHSAKTLKENDYFKKKRVPGRGVKK